MHTSVNIDGTNFSLDEMYLNREISDLAFIDRVEEEVSNADNPPLERLKFLAIASGLVDEFYRIRVTGLRAQVDNAHDVLSIDGKTPLEQLALADLKANDVAHGLQMCWLELSTTLSDNGIKFLNPKTLDKDEAKWLKSYFKSYVFPALTPITVNPKTPFPFVADGKIFIVISLKDKQVKGKKKAIISLPNGIDRFIQLPSEDGSEGYRFVTLEDTIIYFIDKVFKGLKVKDVGMGRIIREGNLQIDDDAEDLIKSIENALQLRKTARVVRLEITDETSEEMTLFMAKNLQLLEDDSVDLFDPEEDSVNDSAYVEPGVILGLRDFMSLLGRFGPECDKLRFKEFEPTIPAIFTDHDGDMFSLIKKQDVLLHWPFEPFDVLVNFLKEATLDENVVAIKQTLYRAGDNSPVVNALIKAAEKGKAVTVIVELGARDDEDENISLARRLEVAGAHVVYGFKGKKVHAKMLMVLRREEAGLVPYVHVSTGNYHARTAAIYCDVSLFSAKKDITSDVVHLFHYISGDAKFKNLKVLSVAPINMRRNMISTVDEETDRALAGKPAAIWLKLNRITDPKLIKSLYRASNAGVQVELFIRGICCLKPGVPGLSENIKVKSIIGRYLEHARIMAIGNGQTLPSPVSAVYLSSADWMPHKMDQRVEVLFPVSDEKVSDFILNEILSGNQRDDKQSWNLESNGDYVKVPSKEEFSIQQYFLDQYS